MLIFVMKNLFTSQYFEICTTIMLFTSVCRFRWALYEENADLIPGSTYLKIDLLQVDYGLGVLSTDLRVIVTLVLMCKGICLL